MARNQNSTRTPVARQSPSKAATGTQPSATATLAPAAERQHELKPMQASSEAISRRAYDLYVQRLRSGEPGDELGDWCAAERELNGR